MFSPLKYHEPLFRPPAEGNSLIFQVTLGCSWNKCAFCEMYSSKKFKMKKEEKMIEEIKAASEYYSGARKIFLADGNAMALSSNRLMKILDTINTYFPNKPRISSYALPADVLMKSPEELKELRDNGLKLIYVGIETGDDELLKLVNKGETFATTVDGLNKAHNAGIKSSVMVLNGLGGKKYSEQHAFNSARVINETSPQFLSTLVLSFPYGVEHYINKFQGEYQEMTMPDLLLELKQFLENIDKDGIIFRSNHASNYLPLKGTLGKDKQELVGLLDSAIRNPENYNFRHENQRGL